MQLPDSPPARQGPWLSLWVVAGLSLIAQLAFCQIFSFGKDVPVSIDVNPSNLWKLGYHFPPTGSFQVLNWLGVAHLPQSLNLFSLAAALLPIWWFFTTFAPVMATFALLAMTAFLRELEIPRPAALFGGVVYAWQGDILPFVFPGHYAYITSWPFFAIAAWGALRAQRTGYWAYALISGAACGTLVGLPSNTDRGAIDSLLIAALFLTPLLARPAAGKRRDYFTPLRLLVICVATAGLISLAPFLSLFQSNILGVKIGGSVDREQTYKLITQFSLAPVETLTYLVPGFFGWHMSSASGPYWGWIGEWPDWPKNHQGTRNLNLAISTTGTIATLLAMAAACLLVPGRLLGADRLTERQRLYGRVLLALGFVALILSWGWHTGLYRPLFALPLMDKWRNPLKWVEITNFSLVVLSAMGAQHLLASVGVATPEVKIIRRRLAWFTIGSVVVLAVGLLASFPGTIFLVAELRAENFNPQAIAAIMSTVHTSLLVALVSAGLACVLLFALWQPDRLRNWSLDNPWLNRLWHQMLEPEHLPAALAVGLAALAAMQLGWVANQFIDPLPLASLTETNPLLEELHSEGDRVRVTVAVDDSTLNSLLQNQFAALDISCLDVSAASRIPDDLSTFFQTLGNSRARLWFLAGVKNVVMPEQALSDLHQDPAIAANIERVDGYTIAPPPGPNLPSHALVVLKDYLAKATFVPDAETFGGDEPLLKRLADPAWNPRATVLLASTPPPANPAAQNGGAATGDNVDLEVYTPTEIEIQAQSARGGYVLINDQYDPDWEVQINGHDAELLRADYILRAIEVPAGTSSIVMRYRAHYQFAGLRLPAEVMNNFSDGAMLAAWLVAGFVLWRRKRR